MDQLNLNIGPEKTPGTPTTGPVPAANPAPSPATPAASGGSGISINFEPKIAPAEIKFTSPNTTPKDSSSTKTEPVKLDLSKPAPQIISLDIKKEDLAKVATKPSSAWDTGLDTGKNVDFYAAGSLKDKTGSVKLIENVSTQKAKLEAPKMSDLLGSKSAILEQSLEQESLLHAKKKLRLVQVITMIIVLAAIGSNAWLFGQLSPGFLNYQFNNNLRNDIFNLNENLKSVQTSLNTYRYLSGQLYLNQFGYESTRFIESVAKMGESNPDLDKIAIAGDINEAKSKLPDLLQGAKANLGAKLTVDTYTVRGEVKDESAKPEAEFEKALQASLTKEAAAVKAASADTDPKALQAEMAFFDNTIKLVGNKKLLSNLLASSPDTFRIDAEEFEAGTDPTKALSFKKLIENLLASTKVSIATITDLKNSRVKWSDVLDRAMKITNAVNAEHNAGLQQGNASEITYSGFDFNADTGKVTLNGLNTTKSGTNREVVTYLIEAMESSPEFKNVTNRTFPLSKSTDSATGETTYSLNFKLDMEIEQGVFSKSNAPLADLQGSKYASTAKVPSHKVPPKKVKRNQ